MRVFFKEWRRYRNLTQERACERIGIDRSHLSRIERGVDPYNEHTLTAMAAAYRCDIADLFMRNPTDPEGIWSIWDQIKPERRREAVALLRVLADTGTE